MPPSPDLAAAGIDVTFITGSIEQAALDAHDVLDIGRGGMLRFFGFPPPCPLPVIDMTALEQRVADGGGVICESEAFIRDSQVHRSVD